MEVKKANPKQNVEVKGYSANQSVDVRKGYNPQMATQMRNEAPIKEGYNAQQMVQTANNQPVPQLTQQNKSAKT